MPKNQLFAKDGKVEYYYDSVTRIFYKSYFGNITFKDIVGSWEYAIRENLIPAETIGFILDYRGVGLNLEIKDAGSITGFYDQHLDIFANKKIALVMENPDQVISPILAQIKGTRYFPRAFASKGPAVVWVQS